MTISTINELYLLVVHETVIYSIFTEQCLLNNCHQTIDRINSATTWAKSELRISDYVIPTKMAAKLKIEKRGMKSSPLKLLSQS